VGVRFIVGDVRQAIDSLPDGSVDFLLTSPPFFQLRSYLAANDPNKCFEIGQEDTPAEYLDTLLDITNRARRVLADHGSICVELGDSRSGSGGAGGDYDGEGMRDGQNRYQGSAAAARRARYNTRYNRTGNHWRGQRDGHPLDKSMYGIPTLFAWSLSYGRNLLHEPLSAAELVEWMQANVADGTAPADVIAGAEQLAAEGGTSEPFEPWRIRNLVAWARTNPPVGALFDRFRDSVSYLTFASKSASRWFDLDAVRKPLSENSHPRVAQGAPDRFDMPHQQRDGNWSTLPAGNYNHPAGVPPLDHWVISASGYQGSHYAVFPPELLVVPIESCCPRRVCRACGTPSTRVTRRSAANYAALAGKVGRELEQVGERKNRTEGTHRIAVESYTLGWSSCCDDTIWADGWQDLLNSARVIEKELRRKDISDDDKAELVTMKLDPLYAELAAMYRGRADGMHPGDTWRPGVVLDPFGGSGTTADVATSLGRDAVLIDLDARNVELARDRVGFAFEGVEYVDASMAIT
jgi:hypothetical protein